MRKLSAREQMAYRTIATLELERDAALGREAALREELARYKSLFGQAQKAIDRLNDLHPKRMGELAKRLTVAEQLLTSIASTIPHIEANNKESAREIVRRINAVLIKSKGGSES